ncbi:MAG TPA: hypothetical protein VGO16_07525 [Pseudonocardiaceae bacterium]|jgi:hypothetical protein|nr:hypothetical protein [Pseudonocardiaceae bacterium]
MMEESEAPAATVTPAEMAEALAAVKGASPSLAGAIDAGVTPEELTDAHDAVTPTPDEVRNDQS